MLKILSENKEYLALLARRNEVEEALKNAESELERINKKKIEETFEKAVKRYANAKLCFGSISVEKLIVEKNGTEMDENMLKCYQLASKELMEAHDEYEREAVDKSKLEKVCEICEKKKRECELMEITILELLEPYVYDLTCAMDEAIEEYRKLKHEYQKKFGCWYRTSSTFSAYYTCVFCNCRVRKKSYHPEMRRIKNDVDWSDEHNEAIEEMASRKADIEEISTLLAAIGDL